MLVERARAKVNLSLRILGRRGDGYHELESLVLFADEGDLLSLDVDGPRGLTVRGPFASTLAGANLVEVALARALEAHPSLKTGAVTLEKRLPVAAGIGGGSADAAATLRLVARANPTVAHTVDWHAIAAGLGADVPVCLADQPAWMTGIGEILVELAACPPVPAVLVNPRVPVPADKTRQVFQRLGAGPLSSMASRASTPGPFTTVEDVLSHVVSTGNDLEPPARSVVPEIGCVLDALIQTGGCRAARLSGGGPTCFGLYGTETEARDAAAELTEAAPEWWVIATTLR